MKRLMLVGTMLALMAAAAIPALAQEEPRANGAEEGWDGPAAASQTPASERGEVSRNAEPASGSPDDVLVAAPAGASRTSIPLPADGPQSTSCPQGGQVALAQPDAGNDAAGGSVTAAPEPGCDAVPVGG